MSRAYVRLDPNYFERRLDRGDPPGAVGAYIAVLCLAESQPKRGRFRNEAILRALLTPKFARWVPYMIEHGDLIMEGKRLYVEGWDEWQEGDATVPERMARLRAKRTAKGTGNGVTPDTPVPVTPVTSQGVYPPSSGGGGAGLKRRLARRKDGEPIALSELLDEIVP